MSKTTYYEFRLEFSDGLSAPFMSSTVSEAIYEGARSAAKDSTRLNTVVCHKLHLVITGKKELLAFIVEDDIAGI